MSDFNEKGPAERAYEQGRRLTKEGANHLMDEIKGRLDAADTEPEDPSNVAYVVIHRGYYDGSSQDKIKGVYTDRPKAEARVGRLHLEDDAEKFEIEEYILNSDEGLR